MESRNLTAQPGGLRPILTVRSQAEFSAALRARRLELNMTLADLDTRAGFHDGYTAHLERPFSRSGKRSLKLTEMGAIWMDALGAKLVMLIGDDPRAAWSPPAIGGCSCCRPPLCSTPFDGRA